MREIVKLGLILLIITSVAGIVLGITNDATMPVIQQRAKEANEKAMKELLPEAEEFNKVEDSSISSDELVVEVYEGKKGGNTVGYTVKTKPVGYGGEIELITGISFDGKITGIKIGRNQETPGLGTKVTEPAFKDQYVGKEAGVEFIVTKGQPSSDEEIQAVTGATISSKAITKGVNASINIFKEVLQNR